ncbi:hypothetical protein RGE_19060 [Rubrivivax gelatinosus IL144]|uniref:Uncharacterized protein n=1 Tax=Rubrivivax gelatinosus (strain NBRC 100245 / IL144) TaxID=983917 RepID=I0HQG0_RUBGI|nr:hypothetical protein RGE_19060 [Rubrivivax gelatinosus IL144]
MKIEHASGSRVRQAPDGPTGAGSPVGRKLGCAHTQTATLA